MAADDPDFLLDWRLLYLLLHSLPGCCLLVPLGVAGLVERARGQINTAGGNVSCVCPL